MTIRDFFRLPLGITFIRLMYTWIVSYFYFYIKRPLQKEKYKKLEKFKGIHKGQRVFVIVTGPSLTIEDVNLLKNEITFGVNSTIKLFDKTDWRPTYYGIMDRNVYEAIKEELINNSEIKCGFYNDARMTIHSPNWYPVPVKRKNYNNRNELRKLYIPEPPFKSYTSENITNFVHEGQHVGHFILQICMYMGFSEIYLIGADCNAPSSHSQQTSYRMDLSGYDFPDDIYKGMMADYKSDKAFAERKGIKIINVTRGGELELFPRMTLEQVLKNDYIVQ